MSKIKFLLILFFYSLIINCNGQDLLKNCHCILIGIARNPSLKKQYQLFIFSDSATNLQKSKGGSYKRYLTTDIATYKTVIQFFNMQNVFLQKSDKDMCIEDMYWVIRGSELSPSFVFMQDTRRFLGNLIDVLKEEQRDSKLIAELSSELQLLTGEMQ